MFKIYQTIKLILPILFVGSLLLSSCSTPHNVVYLSNLDSVRYVQVQKAAFKQPLIQSDDVLNITIQTQDFTDPSAIGQTSSGSTLAATPNPEQKAAPVNGFLVNTDGNVEIPIIGVVKVAELTTDGAKEAIKKAASKYYKDPTVQVRFSNYKVTILGEVSKPASYVLPNEKVTIFDAISLAGDLTIFGKRDNVMLMRDNGDKKDIVRLDLTKSDVIASPYYYLRQNDVIYVEPTKARIAQNNAPRTQLITILISAAAVAVTLLTRF